MQTVNIGILAHVDAGKTSLTERLLFDTGVIDRLGSVDSGTTQTDTGDIERRRGITIRSAVAAFTVGDRQVNLIDTPGHSDFVAEVERALGVLDGAVLVVSAVEGVQPHTRLLMKTLKSLRLPTLIFVNKIDRMGARAAELVEDIARLLTPAVAPLGAVRAIGTPEAEFTGYPLKGEFTYHPLDGPDTGEALASLAPLLAEHDDALLAALVDDVTPTAAQLLAAVRTQTAAGAIFPLLYGSAITGAGVPALLDAIGHLLPPSPRAEAELRGRVFAIESGAGGEKVAIVRSYGGDLRRRQRVTAYRREPDGRIGTYRVQVTALHVVGATDDGSHGLTAGHIAKVHGFASARIGDQLGSADGLDDPTEPGEGNLPSPSLETVVRPRDEKRSDALHAALLNLADSDPLIRTRVTSSGETSVLLYGEVQKEVIGATLAEVYGIEAAFAPSRIMHLERPIGVGNALEIIGHGFLATIGLRVEPGDGVRYRLEVELGSLPLSFHKAIEDSVRQALVQGVFGWPVTDITVTLTHSGYSAPESVAGDFRDLAPHVLMQALAAARTRVFEPCHRFELDVPADRLGAVTAYLAHIGARIDTTAETTVDVTVDSGGTWHITGEIPARLVYGFQQRLSNLSNGEGLWSSVPKGDRAVIGEAPRRARTDGNPFDRVEYTRFLAQRSLANS